MSLFILAPRYVLLPLSRRYNYREDMAVVLSLEIVYYDPWSTITTSASPRPTITCDLRHFLFYWPRSVYYFSARRKAATSFRAAAGKLALSGRRAENYFFVSPRNYFNFFELQFNFTDYIFLHYNCLNNELRKLLNEEASAPHLSWRIRTPWSAWAPCPGG